MSSIGLPLGARRLLAVSIVARLPLAAFSIALLLQAQHLTGSFAAAGVVAGVYAVSLGIGGPILGQLVDRHGQTTVLLASAGGAAVLLIVLAALPTGAPLAAIAALAIGAGLSTPPLDACVQALFPALLSNRDAVRAAYALDATASELTYICGPPLALLLGAMWSTGAALAAGGCVLLLATIAFAAQPASRDWQPATGANRPLGGSLRTPAMRTLVMILIAVGVLFGAAEVAVTAAAEALGSKSIAAPLLALWGTGSLAGGLVASRLRSARRGTGLTWILTGLAAGHLSLAAAAGNPYVLGAALLLAGAAIAPTYARIFAIVDLVTPPSTVTEAFSWLNTAVAFGAAIGAAAGATVAGYAGPAAAFALAGAAGALAALTATVRSCTLVTRRPGTEPGRSSGRSGAGGRTLGSGAAGA